MPNPVTKLFLLLLFGVFFNPFAGLGQISKPQWVDGIGGPDANSIPSAVKIDKQNNVYVTGLFSGTVDFDPTLTGVYNLSTASDNNDFDIFNTSALRTATAGQGGFELSISYIFSRRPPNPAQVAHTFKG